MPTTSYGDGLLWLVIVVIAVGTFLIRLSFVQLFGRLERVPTRIDRILRFVPPAVLTALFVPAFLPVGASPVPVIEPATLLAGVVGGAAAWRTGSVVWTLLAGMGTLWLVSAVL